jgi:hypothetical protein
LKKILLSLLFVFCLTTLRAQKIVGRWQAQFATLSNEDLENYQFFNDGTFCFNTYGDDGLSRIQKICGTYMIAANKIILTPTYYTEKTDGDIVLDGVEPGTAVWRFENIKLKKILINNPVKKEVPFKLYTKQNSYVIEIDGSQYYKINNDPAKYH